MLGGWLLCLQRLHMVKHNTELKTVRVTTCNVAVAWPHDSHRWPIGQ
jgi:hypothetical protein